MAARQAIPSDIREHPNMCGEDFSIRHLRIGYLSYTNLTCFNIVSFTFTMSASGKVLLSTDQSFLK